MPAGKHNNTTRWTVRPHPDLGDLFEKSLNEGAGKPIQRQEALDSLLVYWLSLKKSERDDLLKKGGEWYGEKLRVIVQAPEDDLTNIRDLRRASRYVPGSLKGGEEEKESGQ